MLILPTDSQIQSLHHRLAPSEAAYQLIYDHCVIVCQIAEQLMTGQKFSTDERALVRAGCLLHDIGIYDLYDATGQIDHANYIRHGILGYARLRAEGFDEIICRFASCHTGVGLTIKDIANQGLPLPPADYLAETRAERLLMYADNFHSKTTPPKFMTSATFATKIARFGVDKSTAFQALIAEFGEPDLISLARAYDLEIT